MMIVLFLAVLLSQFLIVSLENFQLLLCLLGQSEIVLFSMNNVFSDA